MYKAAFYSDLRTGGLKNVLAGDCRFRQLLPLIQQVNKKVIAEDIPVADVSKYIKSFDFRFEGYRKREDFEIKQVNTKKQGYCNLEIKPTCFYELQEGFDLLQPPDLKSALFLGLFCDEFERIKSRALYFLEQNDDPAKAKMFAVRNLQFTRTCIRHNKAILHELVREHPEQMMNTKVFIYFYLNFFLVRVRIFYHKLFEHFVPRCNKSEDKLISELYMINFASMQKRGETLESYFQQHTKTEMAETTITPYKTKRKIAQHGESDSSMMNTPAAKEYQNIQIQIQIGEKMYTIRAKLKWNGQVNVLADIFHQLMYEIFVDGKPILEAHLDDVVEVVSIVFCDKNCDDFSKATLRTDMQRGKSDKRPKPGSKEKIDIKNIIGD